MSASTPRARACRPQDLRAVLVEHAPTGDNVSRVAVSAGDIRCGTAWTIDPPAG
jgi:hypothetical protein